MRRNQLILATAIYTAAAASSASAHHSHPYFYDQCTSIAIEGRIESVQWKDPHSGIVLRLDDGTAYTVDWMGLRGLTSRSIIGTAQKALVAGARVAVTGHPIRDAAQIREHFPEFKNDVNPRTVDPRVIRTISDSFSWAPPPSSTPPDCGRK
jgi:hypothetical protein